MRLIAALLLGTMLAAPSLAQEAGSESESSSGASAGAVANIYSSNPSDVNLYNTPNAMGPALTAGLTDCTGSTSGGIGWAGFGLSLGRTRAVEGCERRNNAIMAGKMGLDTVAFEIMCQDDEFRRAALRAGTLCLIDREHDLVIIPENTN